MEKDMHRKVKNNDNIKMCSSFFSVSFLCFRLTQSIRRALYRFSIMTTANAT